MPAFFYCTDMDNIISSEDYLIYDIIGRMIVKKTEDRLSMKEVVARLVSPRKVVFTSPGTKLFSTCSI